MELTTVEKSSRTAHGKGKCNAKPLALGARGATRAAGMESLQSIQALLLEIFPRACGRKKERKSSEQKDH